MRLLLFTTKLELKEIKDKSVYWRDAFFNKGMHQREMSINYELVRVHGDMPTLEEGKRVEPILTVAKIYDLIGNRPLCLDLMYKAYFNLQCETTDGLGSVIVELEVPEEEISFMREHDQEFWVLDKAPEGIPERLRKYYGHNENLDKAVTRDYADFLRNSKDQVYAILPYIKESWIVAIHRETGCVDSYNTMEIVTEFCDDSKLPLWSESIYINGDGHKRYMRNGSIEKVDD